MSSYSEPPLKRAVKDIVGGTIGGIGLTIVGHPFDTLKVRLQTQSHTNPRYSGLVDCVKQTYHSEGLLGFYRGVASPLIGQMFFNAVQFMAYGAAKEIVAGSKENISSMTISQFFIAGGLTGAVVAFVEGPIDLMKTQLQTQIFQTNPKFKSLPETVSYITRNGGLRGIYQGLGPTMIRNIPAVSCYFGFFELTKRFIAKRKQISLESLTPFDLFTSGAMGGLSYWIFTFPIDSIKSLMMSDEIHKHQRKYPTMISAASAMYKQGGIKRFFNGLSPCLLRAAPANAVCFLLYEESIKQMNKMF